MNASGDAAEQIIRFSLEGAEVALKITGAAAKNIAAMIYAIVKNRDKTKTKGRQRLSAMLKSGKELQVFTLRQQDLKQFTQGAKRYGVVYCALRNKRSTKDGMVDIIVRSEDASRINRVVERFKLTAVHTISNERMERDLEPLESGRPSDVPPSHNPEREPAKMEAQEPVNPTKGGTEKSPPSEPISKRSRKSVEDTSERRPSVREKLREIREQMKEKILPTGKEPKQQAFKRPSFPQRKKKAKERV